MKQCSVQQAHRGPPTHTHTHAHTTNTFLLVSRGDCQRKMQVPMAGEGLYAKVEISDGQVFAFFNDQLLIINDYQLSNTNHKSTIPRFWRFTMGFVFATPGGQD